MIRLTWRQFRAQAEVAGAALVVLAVVLAVSGPQLAHLYDTTVVGCRARGDCPTAIGQMQVADQTLRSWLDLLVVVVPGLVGVFWGAPLVARELETGTFRLAWTQGITRSRWLAVKLVGVGLAAAVAAGLVTLGVVWWAHPISLVTGGRLTPGAFSMQGVVPVAYALFAFTLGAVAGLVLRRTLPAMGVTLVGFVLARLAVTFWVRPHLLPPARLSVPLTASSGIGFFAAPGGAVTVQAPTPDLPNAWVLSSSIVDRAGHAPPASLVGRVCHLAAAGPPQGVSRQVTAGGPLNLHGTKAAAPSAQAHAAYDHCVTVLARTYHTVVTYQPASRFWDLQWLEAGVFVVAAALLAAAGVWWLRRRAA